jgi:hypothetical protein
MSDHELAERLRLLDVIWTPTRRWRNQVVEVGENSITVRSEQTGRDRVIPFHHIRESTTENGCIVNSIRLILGLEQHAVG